MHLGARQVGVPEVDDQDEALGLGVVPRLVLERVIEHQAVTLAPSAGTVLHPDGAVSVGYRDPEVAAQAQVRRSAMRRDMRAGSHPRHVAQPRGGQQRAVPLDHPGGRRAGGTGLRVAAPALVEEHDVPVAGARDRLALRREARRIERQQLPRICPRAPRARRQAGTSSAPTRARAQGPGTAAAVGLGASASRRM